MNLFVDEHFQLLKLLLAQNVKFILVGGYAVICYGYKRTTGDLDIWFEPTNENKLQLIKVLKQFDFDSNGVEHIAQLDFTTHLAFNFWDEPERVYCLTAISNVNFNDAYEQRTIANYDGINIPFIHYNHLVLSKISSERLKDRADVEELQKINNLKP